MTATDTEIRNTFQNLRRMLAERFGGANPISWAATCVAEFDFAINTFDLATQQHITAESLGDHS